MYTSSSPLIGVEATITIDVANYNQFVQYPENVHLLIKTCLKHIAKELGKSESDILVTHTRPGSFILGVFIVDNDPEKLATSIPSLFADAYIGGYTVKGVTVEVVDAAAVILRNAQAAFDQVSHDAHHAFADLSVQKDTLEHQLTILQAALKKAANAQKAEEAAKLKAETDLRVQHAKYEAEAQAKVAEMHKLQLAIEAEKAKYAKVAPKPWNGLPVTTDTTSLIIDELTLKNASEVDIDADYLSDAEKRVWRDKCLIAGGISDVENGWYQLPNDADRYAKLNSQIRRYIATVNAWLDKTGTTVAYICDSPKGLAIRREHLIIATSTSCLEQKLPLKLVGLPIENAESVRIAGSRMSATNADITDSQTLRRVNAYVDFLTAETVVEPADGHSSWAGQAAESCMSYQGTLIVPETQEQTTTVDEARAASEKATHLIEREIARFDKLDVLFEKVNAYSARTATGNSKKSTGALKEQLERLEMQQKLENAKANYVIVKRKAQASVLVADSKLKYIVDETNGKKNLSPDIPATFPSRLQ